MVTVPVRREWTRAHPVARDRRAAIVAAGSRSRHPGRAHARAHAQGPAMTSLEQLCPVTTPIAHVTKNGNAHGRCG